MPLDKDELDLADSPPRFRSPAALLRANPDQAYTLEEIDARSDYPVTRVGLQLYLQAVKTVALVPRIGFTTIEGKEYYYWTDDDESNP